jgi:hypothetical protein
MHFKTGTNTRNRDGNLIHIKTVKILGRCPIVQESYNPELYLFMYIYIDRWMNGWMDR